MAPQFAKPEAKLWARENFKGLEAPIFPSFTPDLSELDEDGIRWDVNHIIANGMVSILIAGEVCSMTQEERKRFVSIVNDEAKGRAFTSVTAILESVEQNIDIMKHHEKTEGTLALLGHPVAYDPESEEEIYRNYKYMCDSTDLAIQFYPGRLKAKRFHPSGWPMDLLPRIAEIENVVAAKITGSVPLTFTLEFFHRIGDMVLVADPTPCNWFVTVTKFGQQWAGAAPFYSTQTPEDQRNVKLFNALVRGDYDEAFKLYWQSEGNSAFSWSAYSHVNYAETGIVSAYADKYTHWCNGGNGGLLRPPAGRLYDYQREAMRAGLRAIGLTPRENEEEFFVGRVNYAKGARLRRY
jgi:4-hydroxy-tetrahydrodipicolinate synthase